METRFRHAEELCYVCLWMPSKTSLDRASLQRLAERYARDAQILLENRAWSSAYYLAGYAIECALKACIARQFRRYQYPDLNTVKEIYIHDLSKLMRIAGLAGHLLERSQEADRFGDYWSKIVTGWTERSRYEEPTRAMAIELVTAVSDTREGVLAWIRRYW